MKDEEIIAIGAKHGIDPEMAKVLHRIMADAYQEGRRAGFDAAKEQAAEVADDWSMGDRNEGALVCSAIAAAIRSMEPKP